MNKFPKSARLRFRSQYRRLAREAQSRVGRWIIVEFLNKSNALEARLGITVTRKYGKAHDRNRFKRIVREAFRRCRSQLKTGLDLLVRPRGNARNAMSVDIEQELRSLLPPPSTEV